MKLYMTLLSKNIWVVRYSHPASTLKRRASMSAASDGLSGCFSG